jgi:hypothetical protein
MFSLFILLLGLKIDVRVFAWYNFTRGGLCLAARCPWMARSLRIGEKGFLCTLVYPPSDRNRFGNEKVFIVRDILD